VARSSAPTSAPATCRLDRSEQAWRRFAVRSQVTPTHVACGGPCVRRHSVASSRSRSASPSVARHRCVPSGRNHAYLCFERGHAFSSDLFCRCRQVLWWHAVHYPQSRCAAHQQHVRREGLTIDRHRHSRISFQCPYLRRARNRADDEPLSVPNESERHDARGAVQASVGQRLKPTLTSVTQSAGHRSPMKRAAGAPLGHPR
jgi:hypothetical protein